MKFLAVEIFLVTFGLTLAAPSHHHDSHHATSYASVTKHDTYPHHKAISHDVDNGHHAYELVAVKNYDHGGWHKHSDHGDKHAKYNFDYGVKDLKTGDIKNHWEHRHGDHVKGSYSLKEADGTTRVVEYTADGHNGFNAIVKKVGHAEHPVHYNSGWSGDSGYKGHGHGHDHGYGHGHSYGHATSYIKVDQH